MGAVACPKLKETDIVLEMGMPVFDTGFFRRASGIASPALVQHNLALQRLYNNFGKDNGGLDNGGVGDGRTRDGGDGNGGTDGDGSTLTAVHALGHWATNLSCISIPPDWVVLQMTIARSFDGSRGECRS